MPKQSRPVGVQDHRPWFNVSTHNVTRVYRAMSLVTLRHLMKLMDPMNLTDPVNPMSLSP